MLIQFKVALLIHLINKGVDASKINLHKKGPDEFHRTVVSHGKFDMPV